MSAETATRWNKLHADPRHRLRYPSEHVVRFLVGLPEPDDYYGSVLDIGCGSGRHLALLRDLGFFAYGVDASFKAVVASRERGAAGGVEQAPMTQLPHPGNHFDVVLAYGVFYYGTPDDMHQAVAEMHRVMRPGGYGFIKTRTPHDWRADGIPEGDPEHGMEMTFLERDDVARVFAAFSTVTFEVTSTSSHERERWNSDWLISVQK